MKVRILPVSTIDDTRTILQEVMRIRKYLEENPIRNIFFINTNYIVGTIAYNVSDIYINSSLDVTASADDCLVFKNGYIGIIDSIGDEYVTVQGVQPFRGEKGDTGATGATGADGVGISSIAKTGTEGLVDTYTITLTNGNTATFTVTNGADGQNGQNGADGTDGVGISSIAKTGTEGLVDTYTITLTNGNTATFTVTNGANGTNGAGVPTGGTTGQVLKKKSGTDYDTEWGDVSGGGTSIGKNLFLNPNFEINQRGSSTYSEPSDANNKYTVDRWFIRSNASLNVISNGVRLNCDGGVAGIFGQVLDTNIKEYSIIKGNKVTFSIKIGSTVYTKTVTVPSTLTTAYLADDTIFEDTKIVIHTTSDGLIEFLINYSHNGSIDIEYAKLELGETATQFIPPNYIEELEKCKYYFEPLKNVCAEISIYYSSNTVYITGYVYYKLKRITPTITGDYNLTIRDSSSGSVSFTVNLTATNVNRASITGPVTQSLSVSSIIGAAHTPSLTAVADAEIYS